MGTNRPLRGATAGPLDQPAVLRLTQRFLRIKSKFLRQTLASIAAMGAVLVKARPVVQGQWGRWLRSRLGISYVTGERYVQVYEMARKDTAFLAKFGSETAGRAYAASKLDPTAREALKRDGRSLMKAEVLRVTAPFIRAVPARGRASALKATEDRIQELSRRLAEAAKLAERDPAACERLRGSLHALDRVVRRVLHSLVTRKRRFTA